jgi:phosphoglucosamine mutase
MRKLFGTDGIRGRADRFPFDDATLRRIGIAIASVADNGKGILIAEDTRESSPRIARSIGEGLRAGKRDIVDAGVFPTPALSYILNHSNRYSMGVMISASHNPFEDNGIKVLSGNGMKIPDELEMKIEAVLEKIPVDDSGFDEKHIPVSNVEAKYISDINSIFAPRIKKQIKKAVIDCANGATYNIAPEILTKYIENLTIINHDPDGKNINKDCGSTHLESLRKTVLEHSADLGIAFDGDGDRALFIDHEGSVIDGDHILAFCAAEMKKSGELGESGVVSTVMANFGLEEALQKSGIQFHRIESVGDRYVWQKMLETGSTLGGEQSGHIIFRNHSVTGDGIITALKVLEIMSASAKTLKELARLVRKYPQHLLNVRVERKPPIESMTALQSELGSVNADLSGKGRISVRYSGTENLLRIMIEGSDQTQIEACAARLARAAVLDIK